MRASLEDVYEFLANEEAKDEVGSNPIRAIRIIKIEDNILQIDELITELVKLKSGVEDAQGYDFYDRRRTGLF